MADRILLTDAFVHKLNREGVIVHDTEVPGFQVWVGKHRKTYRLRLETRVAGVRKCVNETIGHASAITAKEARKLARKRLVELTTGDVDLSKGPTLRQGWERKRLMCINKNRSAKTIEAYRHWVEYHMDMWLDLPLREITPTMAIDLFNDITVGKHHPEGKPEPTTANRVLEILRGIYNVASKEHRKILPQDNNPTSAIPWHSNMKRRQRSMRPEDLADWWKKLQGNVGNPVRREFHLFMLLCGSRPEVLRCVPRHHVRLTTKALFFDKPKGGESRAFWIPLSDPMVECLERAIKAGEAYYPLESKTWLWPAHSASGHMEDQGERRTVLPKWGNDLRQTYRTLAHVAGVSKYDVMVLMNHKLPDEEDVETEKYTSDVSDGYISDFVLAPHLRAAQDKISAFIMDALQRP